MVAYSLALTSVAFKREVSMDLSIDGRRNSLPYTTGSQVSVS